jgi:hypothetical protein
MANDEKGKEALKCYRWNYAHIDRGNRLGVVAQKRLPGLRRGFASSHHVFRHRRLSDFETQHQQLAVDP